MLLVFELGPQKRTGGMGAVARLRTLFARGHLHHRRFSSSSSSSSIGGVYSGASRWRAAHPSYCGFELGCGYISAAAGFKVRHFAASAASSDSEPSVGGHTSESLLGSLKEMGSQVYNYSKHTVMPSLQEWLDPTSPYTMQGVIPATVALASCAAAWMVLPRVLRRLHNYVEQGPSARLLGHTADQVPYDMSVWSALEDPTRLFLTLIAFSQLAALIAPSTGTANYLEQVWRGGMVISLLWFLHRWKSVAFSRVLIGKATTREEQERYLALDKISSVGLIVLGAMALAEASGVAVQSILTVGGIGGIATAFAAKDILGNALSGLILQFLKPFSVGDTINAGNIEGQVMQMGLHSTSLLNADKFPVVVPNSFFSSQVIVNKSRAQRQYLKSRIYIRFGDIDKVPTIASQVVELLKAHPKVISEKEDPLCFISKAGPTFLEITIGYDIRLANKQESLALEQEILVKAADIFKKSGAMLGAPDAM